MAEFPSAFFDQPNPPPSRRNEAAQSTLVFMDISEVDSTPLDLDDDHFDVQSELVQVAAKWRSIGIALRLKSKILDGIQAENRNDVTACLTLMVTEWLSRNYNVKRFGEPTWQRLVEAVGHMAGGANMALAKEIAWRHKARGQKAEGQPTLAAAQKTSTSSQGEAKTQNLMAPKSSNFMNVSEVDSTPLAAECSPDVIDVSKVDSTPLAAQNYPEVIDASDVDSTPLDYGHLVEVQSELKEAAANWKSIGIVLQLKPDFLQSIETRYSSEPCACLSWMLMEWLMRNYNVEQFGEPTWKQLVEAVGHREGGANMALAREIARRHKAGVAQIPILTVTQQVPPNLPGRATVQTNSQQSSDTCPLHTQDKYPGGSSQHGPPRSREEFSSTNKGAAPILRDLSLLPVLDWYLLGLQLGVSAYELSVIQRNYPRDNQMCKVMMFEAWLRMDTSASYEKLARVLAAVGKRNIAEAMCTTRGIPLTVLDDASVATVEPLPPTPTLPPEPPEYVSRYAQYLKDRYKRMSTLPDGDWPPSLGRQYTRLAMIEQKRELPGAELVATMERDYIHGNIDNIVKRKKAIQLPEVFLPTEDGGQQLKVLMDGAPGVGKSTLSRKVCKDWSSGELLEQYHLVMLLPLRQTSIREATSIENLILIDDPDLKQQVVQHIQRTSGEHVLLIVDGYDELSYEARTKHSLFLDIVKENQFPKCSVLVTSRPYASDYLQQLQCVNRHVEVLGFTEEQIEHCIMQNIPDKSKATALVEALKERQDITSLCYIPLNCAIVLYVYERQQCTLPHSLTKLYETFIINAVKRHASIAGSNPIIRRLQTLEEIPESFQKHLNAVSKLAYDGLVADKMVFSIEDVKAAFPDCSDNDIDVRLLGLMTVFKEFTSTGEELNYQFLHLTIQEFLSARWAASQLSDDELLKFFQDHMGEGRYRMVLLFLAGISQLDFPAAENLFQSELKFENLIARFAKVCCFFVLAHLIFESQNLSLFRNLASMLQGAKLSVAWYSLSPFDCLVLSHFLEWCDCSLKLLDLGGCGLTNQSLEVMHKVNLEHHGTTQIEEVNLSYSHPGMLTKLSLLPNLPMFEHTRVLKLHCPQYPEGVSHEQVELHCLLNMRYLTTLEISVKEIPDCSKMEYFLSLATFAKALRKATKLQKLQYCKGNIDNWNAFNIFRSLEHNTSLEELDLSDNSQLGDSEEVAYAIERMLNVNRTLKVLTLCNCGLDATVATSIFSSLEHNTSLEKLDISENSQLAKGNSEAVGCAVERMLNVNTTLKVLNLGHCKLDTHIAVALAKMLSCNKSLTELSLFKCDVPEAGLREIARGLQHNTSLKKLDIGHNKLGMQGSVSLAEMLSCNKSLTELHLCGCDIPEAGLRAIARGLLHITSLEKLNISNNKLGVEGAVALAKMLSCNKSLTELNLVYCYIPAAGLREIAGGLLQNTTLQTLELWSSQEKSFLEAEIERLKKIGNFTPWSLSKLEIKTMSWL